MRAVDAGETAGVLPEDGTPGGLPKSSRLARPVRKRPRDWGGMGGWRRRSSRSFPKGESRETGRGAAIRSVSKRVQPWTGRLDDCPHVRHGVAGARHAIRFSWWPTKHDFGCLAAIPCRFRFVATKRLHEAPAVRTPARGPRGREPEGRQDEHRSEPGHRADPPYRMRRAVGREASWRQSSRHALALGSVRSSVARLRPSSVPPVTSRRSRWHPRALAKLRSRWSPAWPTESTQPIVSAPTMLARR
jgi:hypothetical protein